MSDTLDSLIAQVRSLAAQNVIMPVDEIQLATRLSKLSEPRRTLQAVLPLTADPNMHVRRIAIHACRRMALWDEPGLIEALVARLEDDEGWVRHDAAWALGDSGTRSDAALSGLRRLAAGTTVPTEEEEDELDIDDDTWMARVEAAKALCKLAV